MVFFAVADMVAPRVFGLSSTYRHSAAAQMYFTTVAVYFLILFVLSRIGVARRARHDDDCENKVPVGNHFTCQCCFFLLTVYFCCCNPLSLSFHSIELKFALEDDDLTRKEPWILFCIFHDLWQKNFKIAKKAKTKARYGDLFHRKFNQSLVIRKLKSITIQYAC